MAKRQFDANVDEVNLLERFKPLMEKRHGSVERFTEISGIQVEDKKVSYSEAVEVARQLVRYLNLSGAQVTFILLPESGIVEGKEDLFVTMRQPVMQLIVDSLEYS